MIDYVTPTITGHGDELNAMARRCFAESFAHLYSESDLTTFLAQAYGPSGLLKDLGDPDYSWRVATASGRIAAYVKIGPLGLPAPAPLQGALELKQLYVLQPWQGAGIAAELMNWGIATARSRGAPELYLSVFDHNHRAKRFYSGHGFEDVGPCEFRVGDQIDADRMWRKIL